jgi:hypothetical protein
MDNRLNNFGYDNIPEEPEKPTGPPITVDLKEHERLMKITLEMPDENGFLDDDLPDEFDGEGFLEEEIFVREREFDAFVRVLHYNKMRYRVETLR